MRSQESTGAAATTNNDCDKYHYDNVYWLERKVHEQRKALNAMQNARGGVEVIGTWPAHEDGTKASWIAWNGKPYVRCDIHKNLSWSRNEMARKLADAYMDLNKAKAEIAELRATEQFGYES